MKKILVAAMMLLSATAVNAQEGMNDFIELLKSDMKTEKKAIITEVMQFTEAESEAFWPIYREYELELDKLFDERLQLMKDYGAVWMDMDDLKAEELYKRAIKFRKDRDKVHAKYYNKFKKATSAITAVKFAQVQNQIDLLIDLQIAAEVPLVEKP